MLDNFIYKHILQGDHGYREIFINELYDAYRTAIMRHSSDRFVLVNKKSARHVFFRKYQSLTFLFNQNYSCNKLLHVKIRTFCMSSV